MLKFRSLCDRNPTYDQTMKTHTKPQPTGKEVPFTEKDGFIVSKTDLKGNITYVNRTFMRIADYGPHELIGQPHNIIRHPDMPKAAFRLLWDTLKRGEEWFGFVKNLTSNGDHYWVFANITTDLHDGRPVGYYSVRRPILHREVLKDVEALYAQMRQIESAQGIDAALEHLNALLRDQNLTYRQFALKLYGAA